MAEAVTRTRRMLDVAELPDVTFGAGSVTWWGTIMMMAIELGVFALVVASYFYLQSRSQDWPPGVLPPDVLWGTVNTVIFLLSVAPSEWYRRRAHKGDVRAVRIGLVIASLVGLLNIAVRWMEFLRLNTDWTQSAYGSVVWLLIGLHTFHVLTDWVETLVLTSLFFTPHIEGKRFVDAEENASYWYFVVITWLPIYAVLYWAPRLLRS